MRLPTLRKPSKPIPCTNQSALEELGVTVEQLEALEDRPSTETMVVGVMDCPGGDPITGLVFMTDFDATQEYGVGDLRKAITGPEARRFQQVKGAKDYMAFFTDANAILLSSERLDFTDLAWGEPIKPPYSPGDKASAYYTAYATEWDRKRSYCQTTGYNHKLHRMQVAELRAQAKELGIKPLPRKKEALIDAINLAQNPDGPDRWPCWFSDGNHLVLRAEGEGLASRVLSRLIAAADSGFLGIGSGSGAFSTGLFFYDVRDETPELRAEREAQHDWHEARMKELEPVKQRMRERGIRWFFVGKPSLISRKEGEGKSVRYWLNANSYSPRDLETLAAGGSLSETFRGGGNYKDYIQPFGWYTLEELESCKWASDALAERRERDAKKAAEKR